MIQLLKYRRAALEQELAFETSRSGGKGGQHANKTESRVTAVFDIKNSAVLSEQEKERVCSSLKSRIQGGILRVSAEDSRSQHTNKQLATDRLIALLEEGLRVPKKRKPTKISKSQKEARLRAKKQQKEKKKLRQNPRKNDF